jgi:hypothetical protein
VELAWGVQGIAILTVNYYKGILGKGELYRVFMVFIILGLNGLC